jgi:N,N'-diacetyllegionaminate synthase
MIENRRIGAGEAPYVIAEVGINHNGRLELALEHIWAAANAGADAVKFQNWVTEDFISDRKQPFTYKSRGREITEPFYDLLKRYELPKAWLPELAKACREANIAFLSTPTTPEGVDELLAIGVRVLKNGSDYLSHIPLLRYMALHAEAVIISTGMSSKRDIDWALAAVRESNPKCVPILLHCTSLYPTQPEQANLRRMVTLRDTYDALVGYSDHTEGSVAAAQAVALGAVMLEKHFTIDHDLEGPDHWFSVDPGELAVYVSDIKAAAARLGSPALQPAAQELEVARQQRLSAVATRDLSPGAVLSKGDVAFKKPGTGIHPAEIEKYFGREIATAVPANRVLLPELFK